MSAVLTRYAVALAACVTLLGGPAAASASASAGPAPANPCPSAPVTAVLGVTTNRVGVVDLHFSGATGAPVAFFECVGTRAVALGTRTSPASSALTSLFAGTLWRCARLTRHFAATTALPGGGFARGISSTRTPSCARRFELDLPREVARGRRTRVRIVDRWRIGGLRAKLCVTSPRARRTCRTVVFPTARAVVTRHFRATTRGRWSVELIVSRHRQRGSVAVAVRALAGRRVPPTVLATGDSTMGGIDSFLSDGLANSAKVVSEVKPGFAISFANTWGATAAAQVARLRPAQTVVSMGANEGFAMRAADGARHACCEEAWIGEYARRVRKIMLTYGRQGRGRVFWLTIPAPRDRARVPIFDAVNASIVRAAEKLQGVRVLRMDLLFSPHGYQQRIRYRGRDVDVREPDGIHLSVAGTRIAAEVIAAALREP